MRHAHPYNEAILYPTPLLPRLVIPTSTLPPMIRPRRHARISPSSATLSDFVTASPISGKRLSDSPSEFPCRSRWRMVKQVGHTDHMDSIPHSRPFARLDP